MREIKNIWNWLVTSSTDPNKVALSVKAFLTTLGGFLVLLSPLLHLQIGNDQITALVNGAAQLVVIGLTLVSMLVAAFGIVRKLLSTDWKNQPPTEDPLKPAGSILSIK